MASPSRNPIAFLARPLSPRARRARALRPALLRSPSPSPPRSLPGTVCRPPDAGKWRMPQNPCRRFSRFVQLERGPICADGRLVFTPLREYRCPKRPPEEGRELATTPQTASPAAGRRSPAELQELAKRHLWMHFTPMGAYGPDHEVPIIVRGEGCYVWDEHGDRKLDALVGALLRERRPRPHRARRGDGRAGQGARLLHQLDLRAPARDRAGGEDRGAGARRPQPRLLHLRRLGVGRVGLEADARLPQAATARRSAPS